MPPHRDSRLSLTEWLAIAAVVVIWGVNNAAAKFATTSLPPLFVGGARFACVLACLWPWIRPPFPPLKLFLPVLLLVGPVHFGIVYSGFALAHNLSCSASHCSCGSRSRRCSPGSCSASAWRFWACSAWRWPSAAWPG